MTDPKFIAHIETCRTCSQCFDEGGSIDICPTGYRLLTELADETARRIAPEPKGGEA